MDVDVGRHGRGQGDLEAVLALDRRHPHHVEDRCSALDGDESPALDGLGQIDDGLLADLVARLVGREAERRRPGGAFLPGPAGPVGPIDVDDLARSVAAHGVLDPDEVASPAGRSDPERPPAGAVRGRDLRPGDGPVLDVGDVLGERLAALVPPPLPLDPVKGHDDLVPRNGPARGIDGDDVDRMVLVGHEQAPIPVALRRPDADVGIVRVEGQGEGVEAEVAALLEDAAGEGGVEHPGARLLRGDVDLGAPLACGVENAFGRFERPALELAGRVVEGIVLVAVELRRAPRQADRHVELQVRGRRAVEPLGRDRRVEGHVLADERLAPGVEDDLEPVGRDRFDLQRLLEGHPPDEDAGPPVAGGRSLVGLDAEGIERLDGLLRLERPDELPLRRIDLHEHGVAFGQDILPVEQGEGQVERVARPPDAALAVDDAFDALLGDLAADVEVAQGQDALAADAQIADVPAPLRLDVERTVPQREDGEAVAVGGRLAEELILIVVGPDLQARRAAGPSRCRSSRPGGCRRPRAWRRGRCRRRGNCARRQPHGCTGGDNRRPNTGCCGCAIRPSRIRSLRRRSPSSRSGRSRRRPCS